MSYAHALEQLSGPVADDIFGSSSSESVLVKNAAEGLREKAGDTTVEKEVKRFTGKLKRRRRRRAAVDRAQIAEICERHRAHDTSGRHERILRSITSGYKHLVTECLERYSRSWFMRRSSLLHQIAQIRTELQTAFRSRADEKSHHCSTRHGRKFVKICDQIRLLPPELCQDFELEDDAYKHLFGQGDHTASFFLASLQLATTLVSAATTLLPLAAGTYGMYYLYNLYKSMPGLSSLPDWLLHAGERVSESEIRRQRELERNLQVIETEQRKIREEMQKTLDDVYVHKMQEKAREMAVKDAGYLAMGMDFLLRSVWEIFKNPLILSVLVIGVAIQAWWVFRYNVKGETENAERDAQRLAEVAEGAEEQGRLISRHLDSQVNTKAPIADELPRPLSKSQLETQNLLLEDTGLRRLDTTGYR
jgi:hypothetical protein